MCSGYRVVSRRRKGSYKLGGKVVKGEFYSRWGSELLPSTPLILLFLSFSLSLSLSLSLFSLYILYKFSLCFCFDHSFASYISRRSPRRFWLKASSDALCCNGSNHDRLYPPAGSPPPAAPSLQRPGCRESAHIENATM